MPARTSNSETSAGSDYYGRPEKLPKKRDSHHWQQDSYSPARVHQGQQGSGMAEAVLVGQRSGCEIPRPGNRTGANQTGVGVNHGFPRTCQPYPFNRPLTDAERERRLLWKQRQEVELAMDVAGRFDNDIAGMMLLRSTGKNSQNQRLITGWSVSASNMLAKTLPGESGLRAWCSADW